MCETLKLADGGFAFVCGGRHRRPPACRFCGQPSTRLCDGPAKVSRNEQSWRTHPPKPKKSCDAPICNAHARSVGPNRDLCPDCSKDVPEQAALFVGGTA